jgi:hypothetical protein
MSPFAVPKTLSPRLTRARAYWEGLLRGGAEMPFWDDLAPADLGDVEAWAFTLEVADNPQRIRFGIVGQALKAGAKAGLEGLYLDEHQLGEPFSFLLSQASATVESRRPTLHRREGAGGYARLLLPMWGEGRVGLLLGVIETL